MAAALADMGLSLKASWYSASLLYGMGGLTVAGLHLINPTLVPLGIFCLGCAAISVAILGLLTARRLAPSSPLHEPLTHIRFTVGVAIYVAGAIILGSKFNPWALLPLFSVTDVWLLRSWRSGLPYPLAGALITFLTVSLTTTTAPIAHAVVSTFAITVVSAAIIVNRQRTRALARRNRELAYTDPLTGLANVRMLRERIAPHLAGSAPTAARSALFAIDLDNFKEVNDRFNHAMGDAVLCAVAASLREQVRSGDLVARRGGDEFSVLVPDAASRDLDDLRTRLEDAIARARIATCPQVTPSGAVSYVLTHEGDELAALMERADRALHDAKVVSRARRSRHACAPLSASRAPLADVPAETPVRAPDHHSADYPDDRHAPSSKGRDEAAFGTVASSSVVWTYGTVLFSLVAIVTAALSVAGIVRPLSPVAGCCIAAGFLAVASVCVCAARTASEKWLHVAWLAGAGLSVSAIGLAGPSGAALLDLLPAMALYACLIFEARIAALYMVVLQATYAAFAVTHGYTDGVTRAVVTAVIVLAVGGVISKLRAVAIRFARANRELSEVDELTGLANRRALQARLETLVEIASSRGARPLVIAFDLDAFKQVNDVYSHSTGDRLLVAVGRAVSERVRADELVARRGGDEFVIVLANSNSHDADAVVGRIASAITITRERICPELPSTASIAYASWRVGQSAVELLRQADIALHAEKGAAHARRSSPAAAVKLRL